MRDGLSVLRLAFPPHPRIGAPSRTRTCTSRKTAAFETAASAVPPQGQLVRSERLELPCLATTASETVVSAVPPRARGSAPAASALPRVPLELYGGQRRAPPNLY